MTAFPPVVAHPQVQVVESFAELMATPFRSAINALCWPRRLPGDFAEIVTRLGAGEGIRNLDAATLAALPLSANGQAARDTLLSDLALLRAQGLAPELNCIYAYPRDETAATVPTDVYSFHADSAPIEASTWLCTYHGPASEGIANNETIRRIEDPATRAALLREYGGSDDAGFREFLRENCYDLHYAARPTAQPYAFGLGHLWRIAVAWPGSRVLPCIHRAPAQAAGQARLLLIS